MDLSNKVTAFVSKTVRTVFVATVATGTLAAGTLGISATASGDNFRREGKQAVVEAKSESDTIGLVAGYAKEGAGMVTETAGGILDVVALAGAGGLSWARRRKQQKEAQQNNEQGRY